MLDGLLAFGLDVLYILAALLGLSLLIGFHELGHFLAARLCGMSVSSFSIGFGRPLWRRVWKGTEYKVSPILLGGYVRILGMTGIPEIDRAEIERLRAEGRSEEDIKMLADESRWYWNKSGLKQFIVVAAGPLFSILLSLLLFTASLAAFGKPAIALPLTVDTVAVDSPAQAAGLKSGDQIARVNGFETPNLESLSRNVKAGDPEIVLIDVVRDGQTLSMALRIPKESKQRTLGFSFKVTSEELSLFDSLRLGAASTWDGFKQQAGGLIGLVRGTQSADGVSGPIGIIKIGAQFASNGVQSSLYFLAVLSIALGVFNLIPVPPLDGGRMVFAAIKAVSGYSVAPKIQGLITAVGVLAMLALFILATFKDVGFFG